MAFFKHLSTIALGLSAVASVSALSFTDVDVDGEEGEPSYQFMSGSGLSSWDKTFNLLLDGFDPGEMEILSATVWFAFADDSWNDSTKDKHHSKGRGKGHAYGHDKHSEEDEYATVSVGGTDLWTELEVNGSHDNSPDSYDWFSMTLNSQQVTLLQDGVIDYSIDVVSGDFYLKEASLTAEVGRINVPDTGATLGMFGLGLVTLLILRRQMLKGRDA